MSGADRLRGPTPTLRAVGTICRKDLRLAWRSRESLLSMLLFAAMLLGVFAFALPDALGAGNPDARSIAAGIFWVSVAFAGVVGLDQAFAPEREGSALEGILLSPVDRAHVYVGKLVAGVLFLGAVEVPLAAVFVIFYDVDLAQASVGGWALVAALGTVGFAATGTLFAAMGAGLRGWAVLQPLFFFPMCVPLLIAGSSSLAALLGGASLGDPEVANWIRLMAVFDVVFTVGGFLLFPFLVED